MKLLLTFSEMGSGFWFPLSGFRNQFEFSHRHVDHSRPIIAHKSPPSLHRDSLLLLRQPHHNHGLVLTLQQTLHLLAFCQSYGRASDSSTLALCCSYLLCKCNNALDGVAGFLLDKYKDIGLRTFRRTYGTRVIYCWGIQSYCDCFCYDCGREWVCYFGGSGFSEV